MPGQLVLAVPTTTAIGVRPFHGFDPRPKGDLERVVASARFLPRRDLETDPTYKQIIPYVVLRHGDRVFAYRRGQASSEKRLVAKVSIGLGGHVEWSDDSLFDDAFASYLRGTRREVEEEVVVSTTWTERILGFINDDSSDVGRVHLGIVHVWDLAEPAVRARERKITGAGFRKVGEVARLPDLEGWSEHALAALSVLTRSE
jgi:predicted NUDIX family phosphoesterase